MGDTDEVGRLEGRNDGNDVDGDVDGRELDRMEGFADWDGDPENCVEGDDDGVNDVDGVDDGVNDRVNEVLVAFKFTSVAS